MERKIIKNYLILQLGMSGIEDRELTIMIDSISDT